MRFRDGGPGAAEIDAMILSRDGGPLPAGVLAGLASQEHVSLTLHVVDGTRRPDEKNRLETITRARNQGSRLGSAPWLLFLDDDVVLAPGCVSILLAGLLERPDHAALAADYLGELEGAGDFAQSSRTHALPLTAHVAMGATLFRREALTYLAFRWEPGRCECLCCCEDLRRAGLGIAYLPAARATHERSTGSDRRVAPHEPPDPQARASMSGGAVPKAHSPRILTAFDRHHLGRFLSQFLPTLRDSGNEETVTALAYGLWPTEQRSLAAIAGVEPVFLDENGVAPAIRRLHDFQAVVARWPDETPVAQWDAGDVVFQASLEPLWELVRGCPDRILAVREPARHPENRAVAEWTLSIRDPEARRFAFDLLSPRPFVNAGFVAGTAHAMMEFLGEADRLLHSPALIGTSDWGDQTALNLYCHTYPERWKEVPEGWDYTIYQRDQREYGVGADGRFETASGEPIRVVHGNAGTLDWLLLPRLAAARD
jgi:hypothetical protein